MKLRTCLPLALMLGALGSPQPAWPAAGACQLAQAEVDLIDWLKEIASLKTDNCDGVKKVMALMGSSRRKAGRELEKDKPLNVAEAEAELRKAEADAEYRAAAEPELQAEPHPQRRMLLQAAWLHEFGHYKARDLVLSKLAAKKE